MMINCLHYGSTPVGDVWCGHIQRDKVKRSRMTGEVLREWSEEKKVTVCCSFVPFFVVLLCCASPIKRIILFFVEKEKRSGMECTLCRSVLLNQSTSFVAVVVVSAVLLLVVYFVYFHLLQDFLELFPFDSTQLFSFFSLARI